MLLHYARNMLIYGTMHCLMNRRASLNLSTKKLIYISIIGIGVALLLMKLLGAENVNSSIALTGILLAIIFAPICLVLYKASLKKDISLLKRLTFKLALTTIILSYVVGIIVEIVQKYA